MSRFMAVGYALTIGVLCGLIALGRGALPKLDGIETLYLVLALALLLLPAGVMLVAGAKASIGRLRRLLGFLTGVGCVFVGLLAVVLLVIFNVGRLT